jgi:hypothetical protein
MADKEHAIRHLARKVAHKLNEVTGQLQLALVKFRGEKVEIEFNIDLTAETVWATQEQIAELYGVGVPAISKHVSNIYGDGELDKGTTLSKLEIVQNEGGRQVPRQIEHYNLDLILSVGYRVNSAKATHFRQWATRTLRAYIVDGFALNEVRLRDDPNALKRVAAKIRALRSEEKNVYKAVRECFKECAIDYDPSSQSCRSFYARLQDKFLYATTNSTAAQIILNRADHRKIKMGVQSTKGDIPTLDEAKVGKNYLDADELYILHILCEQFLLFAESAALRGRKLKMADLTRKLDQLLETNEYPVFREYKVLLKDRAIQHAIAEYALYRKQVTGTTPKRLR